MISAEEAAMILVEMKNRVFNPQTVKKFRNLDETLDEDMLPNVKKLEGLIGKCCKKRFTKVLTDTDVDHKQCRLSIRHEYIDQEISSFMTEEEKKLTDKDGLEVMIYDLDGNQYTMRLIEWRKVHALRTGWTSYCQQQELRANDEVRLWGFRHLGNQKLCFIIEWVRPKTKPKEKAPSSRKRKANSV